MANPIVVDIEGYLEMRLSCDADSNQMDNELRVGARGIIREVVSEM